MERVKVKEVINYLCLTPSPLAVQLLTANRFNGCHNGPEQSYKISWLLRL